jgi:hypothetical protein
MSFTARITEANDGTYGDITKARPVTFTLNSVGSGGNYTCNVPSSNLRVTPRTLASPGFVDATCTFPAGVAVNVYDLNVAVAGLYYSGSADGILTVFDPSLGGSSGGGSVTNPVTGNGALFGYQARYNKSTGTVGKMIYIETDSAAHQTVLKGNVMSTLAIMTGTGGGYPKTAKITGKATLNGGGNYSYIITGVDAAGTTGEAGDQYGQQVTSPAGSLVALETFGPQAVTGGDVFVGK